MEQLVLDFTRPGEVVCDPFCGSGSTLVAAKVLGRRWLGWEIDPEHHATALRRIADAREQTTIEQRTRHRQVRRTAYDEEEVPQPKQGKLDV
jgi:DNA modification methylase